jgi:hypothetical protein
MAKELRYAVELDLRGVWDGAAWEHTFTAAQFGISGGILRACTGVGALSIEGHPFAGDLLILSGLGKEAKRIDIGDSGNYATFSTLAFEIENVSGLADFLRAEGCFTKNAPVRFWAVEAGIPLLRWAGVVDDDPRGISSYRFECIDESKAIHGNLPVQEINPGAFGWAGIDSDSKGKMIPISIGRLQLAQLFAVTQTENRFRGISQGSAIPAVDVCPLAYFPSASRLGVESLRKIVISVGLRIYNEGAFAGRFLRAVSGKGQGTARRVLRSSASFQIASNPNTLGPDLVQGVELELDEPWPFDMLQEENAPTTATAWSPTATYTDGAIVEYRGEVFEAIDIVGGSVSILPGDPPPPENSNWFPIFKKVPQAQGDATYCADGSPWPSSHIGYYPGGAPAWQSERALFPDTTILEFFAFSAALLASQNPVAELDLYPDYLLDRAGFRSKKDGVEYLLQGCATAHPSGLFPGRSYSGLRLENATFTAEKKLSSYQRVGDVLRVLMGTSYQGPTSSGGFINWQPYPALLPVLHPERLNDTDPQSAAGDDYLYQASDSNGVAFSSVGQYPAFGGVGGQSWHFNAEIHSIPSTPDLSDFSNIIPAARLRLFADCSAATTFRAVANLAVEIETRFGRSLSVSSGSFRNFFYDSSLATDGSNRIEREISVYSFFDPKIEGEFLELSKAIGLDTALAGGALPDWVNFVRLRINIALYPVSGSFADFRPGLLFVEGGLAAKQEIELGDYRTSLRGEVWGSIDPARRPASSLPETIPSVLEYLFRQYDGIPGSKINLAEIDRLETLGVYSGLPIARQITEKRAARDFYIELLAQGLLGCSMGSDGKRTIKDWLSRRTPVRHFSPAAAEDWERILDGSLEDVDPVPLSRVYSIAKINYDWSPADRAFLSSLLITSTWEPEFPGPDEAYLAGDFTADIEAITISDVKARFTGAIPDVAFGDRINFEWSGIAYQGVAAQPLALPDGRTEISINGWFTGDNGLKLFELPAGSSGTTQAGAAVALEGGLLWQTFAQGFRADQYATARDIWQRFRNAWKRIRGEQELPAKLRDASWIASSGGSLADNGSAVAYLDLISKWCTFPKDRIRFAVQAEDNLDLELLDPCEFSDPLLFGGATRFGWVEEIELDPRTGRLSIQLLLDLDSADPYAVSTDIDEGSGLETIGNVWGDIEEQELASNIDEQGGF